MTRWSRRSSPPSRGRRELPPAARLGGFAVVLVAVFAAALSVGSATGDAAEAVAAPEPSVHDGHGGAPEAPAGTTLDDDDLRLDVPVRSIVPLVSTRFAFRVLDADGEPVEQFDVDRGERMHLHIVGRDLVRYAHLIPVLGAGATWTTPLTLAPGSYRAVATFTVGGEARALGVDLVAPGAVETTDLPPPATTAAAGDVRVELARDGDRLVFSVADEAGAPVSLQPHLGARGHLVAFRAGDAAHLQGRPDDEDDAEAATAAFVLDPPPGTYRLFLEVLVADQPRTASFTLVVAP